MGVFSIRTVREIPQAASSGAGATAVSMGPSASGANAPANLVASEQGVFVTPQTIATFGGATLAVSLLWKVAGVIRPGLEKQAWVGLVASVLMGIVLYLMSENVPNRGPVTTSERLVAIFVAVINTLILFSAVMGAAGLGGPVL